MGFPMLSSDRHAPGVSLTLNLFSHMLHLVVLAFCLKLEILSGYQGK